MKTITIFLASSEELKNDRNSLQALMASLDDIYEPRGIRIKCKRWEDFISYCTGERTQDQYNIVVKGSDICICMFHRKAGKYTKEEFKHAMAEYAQNKERPKTYVYVRALVDGEIEEEELKTFKKELFDKIGHYWCNYDTDDMMKLHFVMQLERLMSPSLLGVAMHDVSNLKVEDGKVLLHGRKIADYSNLPFASLNSDYKRLKERIESLNKDILLFRSMGVPGLEAEIFSKSEERSKCQEDLRKLEEQLFSIALTANRIISSGETISERKRMAIEMFERGNIRGVIDVLNEEDLSFDEEQARSEVLRGRQIIESGKEMVEDGIKKIRSLVEEYMMRAEALMAYYSEPERFSLSCESYEKAISLARECLAAEELAEILFKVAFFMKTNKAFEESRKYYEECLEIYRRLVKKYPEAYESDLAMTLNNLANLYSDIQRYAESEEKYNECLEIRSRLVKKYPEAYESDLARTLGNLANLYYRIQRYAESEKKYNECLEIYSRLVKKYPEAYESDLARILGNLALLYSDIQRYAESEEKYNECLEIYSRLVKKYPGAYESDLARTLGTLANLYYRIQRYAESEEKYNECLEIYRRLVKKYPEAYELDLARPLSNLASLYSDKDNQIS